ncbi:CRP/FNR family transcriptional regulator, anaerobic regulatory protein [Nitrosomonas cryotolerans]|uniref:CRP/FNR family transcriptional regulator, anaerobic regulatory protein n=1 Tax=Nitrosomonas cryotolerans ATCC 49181 TaxID=1131553 RepID=A0A1N6FB07_9PROT|nr:fumarate/nitrate reduction transcriptional regulator Fnr [Nitrosomonas cryotolerans]SFP75101.1 CRP/FNR family transcriptional regulator, anaerobic regulatory protein [Nitrosomonas cryotolerans]SIN92471.1 CRP/FNR family transcriptional regulator, anaerobic regulatory protein [Nitrosomonas cryotolerans ATCC 49181]
MLLNTVSTDHLDASDIKANCASCNLRELCLPVGLNEDEIEMLGEVVSRKRRIQRGEYLYHAGSDFQSLFAVRNGFFKTCLLHEDGRQQVVGLHMRGELLGLSAISAEAYTCDAVALEDSEVCEIPFVKLEEITRIIPTLMHHFYKIMSCEIVKDHDVMLSLGSMKADERLAAFLLNLSQRFSRLGYSSLNFNLRMTREEIGSYLGLKLETVSRAFSKLQEEKILTVDNKYIQISDIKRLKSKIGISLCV